MLLLLSLLPLLLLLLLALLLLLCLAITIIGLRWFNWSFELAILAWYRLVVGSGSACRVGSRFEIEIDRSKWKALKALVRERASEEKSWDKWRGGGGEQKGELRRGISEVPLRRPTGRGKFSARCSWRPFSFHHWATIAAPFWFRRVGARNERSRLSIAFGADSERNSREKILRDSDSKIWRSRDSNLRPKFKEIQKRNGNEIEIEN